MTWIKNLSVLIISFMFSLILAESILAYLKPISLRSDPKWVPDGYTRGHFKANQTIRGSIGHNVRNPNHRVEAATYTLNKYGFRGSNWDTSKSNGVAFIGGSSTFSYHDIEDESWPFIATNCLEDRNKIQYQNLNFSQPGYSIFDAPHLYIQKGFQFDIDFIVTYHLWNDIKFIRALSLDPEFFFNTNAITQNHTLKSIFLDLEIFPNLSGNLNILYRKYTNTNLENAYKIEEDIKVTDVEIELTLEKIKEQYHALIRLRSPATKLLLIKQGLLLNQNENSNDAEISWDTIGLTKEQFLNIQSLYYGMLDDLARDYPNVFVLNADGIIPKNLEMYEDHVHLQSKAQEILGIKVCEYLQKLSNG